MSITQDSPNMDMAPGEAFKLSYGYSRTMHNLMRKHNCSTIEEYREIRKTNRKKKVKVKVVKPEVKAPQKGNHAKKK